MEAVPLGTGDQDVGYVHRSDALDLRGTTIQAPMTGKAQEQGSVACTSQDCAGAEVACTS